MGAKLRKSFDGGAPKNKRKPTVDDINWRALNMDECQRLFNIGTRSGKSQALKDIITRRAMTMGEEYKEWRKNLCGSY